MSVDEISGGIIIAIGVVNIVLSGKDRAYSAEILQRPVGIVAKYTPVGPLVATLLYNLIFGGIIAVAGSIYDFTVRNYAMSNQATFLQIEQGFVARQAVR